MGFHQELGIRIHGAFSRNARLKSLRLYARSQYGPDSITYPLFPGHRNNTHERLILRSGGTDWGGVAFRDTFAQSLLKGVTDISIQHHRSAIVFINGEYWGIQQFLDRYDDNYLRVQFGVEQADILESISTVVTGTNTHYLELIDYLSTEDLNAPGRYDWVRSRMDVEDFRDYYIAQSYVANTDQPGGPNIRFWRSRTVDPGNPLADGRWRWFLRDLDKGMNYRSFAGPNRDMLQFNTGLANINSTVVTGPAADVPEAKNTPEATLLLRRMLSNLEFRRDFITRFSDLLNTVFAPLPVEMRLTEFQDEFEPHMPEHMARWGLPTSMSSWHQLLSSIVDFGRNRPIHARAHLREFFNLGAEHAVTVAVTPEGAGRWG